jgi:hypothetical protein
MNDTNEKKPEGNNRPDPKLKNNKPRFSYYWIYALLAVLIIGLQLMNWNTTVKNIGWGELKEMILNQEVERLVLVNK